MICLPNQYKSEARILAADSRSSSGGAAAMAAAAVGVSIPGQESADAAYVDILNSRSMREALLQTKFTFKVRTWYFGSEQSRQQTLYEFLEKKNLDRAVKAMKTMITITRDPKSKLLTLAVETESPQLSQQVVQRMVGMLDEFVVTKSRTRGSAKAAFAERRLVESRAELAHAEETFRAFLEGNRNYLQSPDPSVRLKGQRLENELKLRTQLVTTLAIGREQALLEEKNDMPILNVLDAGNLPIDKSAPARGTIVVAILILSTVLSWFLQNRTQVVAKLMPGPGQAI
jgi:capsule polysaccharide export protein KpsE/RkpR